MVATLSQRKRVTNTDTVGKAKLNHNSAMRELTFLSALEQLAIFLVGLINGDDVGTGKQLHDETSGDDRGDTELHQGTTVGGQDDTHPIERIG